MALRGVRRTRDKELTYRQILVETEPNKLLVTLDDRHKDEKRYWGFHGGTIFPHVTELFIVDEVTPTSIEINGYVPHLNSVDKWCLVVHEDEDGLADDQYPQFIPWGLANYQARGSGTIHRTFDVEISNGKYSLSFRSAHSRVYHLIPSKEADRIVVEQLRSKRYCFKFGPEYTSESLRVLVVGV